MMTEIEGQDWVKDFRQKNGRAPKILHIGNIANNAYQNAKMLIEIGCECDVLSNDYYHIMACPEWDDADFTGDIGAGNFPAWQNADLNGFERPRWFVQAPFAMCRKYLLAKNNGNSLNAIRLWRKMEQFRKKQSKEALRNGGDIGTVYKSSFYYWLFNYLLKLFEYAFNAIHILYHNPKYFFSRLSIMMRSGIRKIFLSKRVRLQKQEEYRRQLQEQEQLDCEKNVRIYQEELGASFPDYARPLGSLAYSFILSAKHWVKLLNYYDIVIGYADSCIYPYLAGMKNYIAYEHGTIRDFPYEDNDRARLTLLAYANAAAIYSTNADCYESAKYIARPHNTPIICGLHGIDVGHIIQKSQAATTHFPQCWQYIPQGVPVFFSPARQDIAIKGNDLILQAAAQLVRDGYDFCMVLALWGADIEQIKLQIAQVPGLASKIVWTNPMGKEELFCMFSRVSAVLDQFVLPAFGAVTIEALCSGSLLLTRKLTQKTVDMYYGKELPGYNCETWQDIYHGLKQVLEDTTDSQNRRAAAQPWIKTYHGKERTLATLLAGCKYAFAKKQ